MFLMGDKVLKINNISEKTEWQRKTFPLRLNLSEYQQLRIDFLISEYKKVIQKAIKNSIKILNERITNQEIDLKIKEFMGFLKAENKFSWK